MYYCIESYLVRTRKSNDEQNTALVLTLRGTLRMSMDQEISSPATSDALLRKPIQQRVYSIPMLNVVQGDIVTVRGSKKDPRLFHAYVGVSRCQGDTGS